MSEIAVYTPGGLDLTAQIEQALNSNQLALRALQQHQAEIQRLDVTKADRREIQKLEAEVADQHAMIQLLAYSRDHITVVRLSSMLKIKFDCNNKTGVALSKVGRRLAISNMQVPDDRFGSVNAYHPYVCRIWCEENNYPLPTALKFADDPR